MTQTKRSTFLLAAALSALALLAAADVEAQLADPVVAVSDAASDATNDNGQRKLAEAPDGTLYLIYTAPVDDAVPTSSKYSRGLTATAVFVARSDDGGQTWSTETRLSREGVSAGFAAIDVGPDERVHASWVDFETVGHVWYAVRGSEGWRPGFKVSPGLDYAGLPAISASPDAVHILWYAAAPDDTTKHGSSYEIIHVFDDGTGWSDPLLLSTRSEDALNPSLGRDEADRVYGAWYQIAGTNYQSHFATWDGTSWTAATAVSPQRSDATGVSIGVSPDGTVDLVWEQATGDSRGIGHARFSEGTWSEVEHISDPGALDPVVAPDGDGGAIALWSLVEEIEGRVYDGGWSEPFALGPGTHPMLLSGDTMRAAWTRPAGGGYEIVFGTLETSAAGENLLRTIVIVAAAVFVALGGLWTIRRRFNGPGASGTT